jgi:hypothetical protein
MMKLKPLLSCWKVLYDFSDMLKLQGQNLRKHRRANLHRTVPREHELRSTTIESHFIRTTLAGVHSDLSRLESQIDQVQAVLAGLVQKRDALRQYSDEASSVANPTCSI